MKVHLHYFSKTKSHKEVTKQQKSMFFLLFLLNDRRIPIRIHISDGSGSGMPKNIWILRIRIGIRNTDSYRTLFSPCFVPLMILPGDLDEGVALEPEPVDLVELPAGELEERLLLALQHLLRHNLDCASRHAFQILAEACAQS